MQTRALKQIAIYETATPPYRKWPKWGFFYFLLRLQNPHQRFLPVSEVQWNWTPWPIFIALSFFQTDWHIAACTRFWRHFGVFGWSRDQNSQLAHLKMPPSNRRQLKRLSNSIIVICYRRISRQRYRQRSRSFHFREASQTCSREIP